METVAENMRRLQDRLTSPEAAPRSSKESPIATGPAKLEFKVEELIAAATGPVKLEFGTPTKPDPDNSHEGESNAVEDTDNSHEGESKAVDDPYCTPADELPAFPAAAGDESDDSSARKLTPPGCSSTADLLADADAGTHNYNSSADAQSRLFVGPLRRERHRER